MSLSKSFLHSFFSSLFIFQLSVLADRGGVVRKKADRRGQGDRLKTDRNLRTFFMDDLQCHDSNERKFRVLMKLQPCSILQLLVDFNDSELNFSYSHFFSRKPSFFLTITFHNTEIDWLKLVTHSFFILYSRFTWNEIPQQLRNCPSLNRFRK